MKRRIIIFLMAIVLSLSICECMEVRAMGARVGDTAVYADGDADLETSREIEADPYDITGMLEKIDAADREQYLRDFMATVMIIDAIQHSNYVDMTKLNAEVIADAVRLAVGEESVKVRNYNALHKIWVSSQSYLKIKEGANGIEKISFVMPEIKNGFGKAISIDFLIDKE